MTIVDLRTEYLGLELRNPLVASASPLTGTIDGLRRLEDAGVGAVVLPSLFEEQIEHEDLEVHRVLETGSDSFPEASGYFPELDDYNTGPSAAVELVREAKAALETPVIASLNGVSLGGWVRYGTLMQEAGADALELNIYRVAADPTKSAENLELEYIDLVRAMRKEISIPLAVKVGPYFTSIANMAVRLRGAGATGLVLFNRFLHPDIDLDALEVRPRARLSTADELGLTLRWIALLTGRVHVSLAASTGVASHVEMLKLLLAGADVTMATSIFLKEGAEHAKAMLDGLTTWMQEREYASVGQLRGSMSQEAAPDPGAFERSQYMRALVDYTSRHPRG